MNDPGDTSKKQIALHDACDTGNTYIVKVLLQQGGATIDLRDSSGKTPLHIACFRGIENIVRLLLQHGANVDLRDSDGRTALHISGDRGEVEVAELLLENGADINITDKEGRTALHQASNKGMKAIAELLLQHQPRVNVRDNFGWTPLHLALKEMRVETLRLLLDNGADVNMKDPDGKAALHLAVSPAGSVKVVELLFQYGPNINLKDADGNTALHLACFHGRKDVADLLLQHKADVHIRDCNGMTALGLAKLGGLKEIADLFLRYADSTFLPVQDREQSAHTHSGGEMEDKQKISTEQLPDTHGLVEGTGKSDKESMATSFGDNTRDGVRYDNGDGFILAKYDNHDIFFDAKLESIRSSRHENEDVHTIQLKLNFMKPFPTSHRIRYAKVDVTLRAGNSGNSPHIRTIMPQADRVEVSEQEITSGQKLTVGASGNGGPSSVNISMEGTKGKRSTFKGVRIIHGAVKDRMHASWRLYEEPGSKSGLPEIARLLLVVYCQGDFNIQLSMSAKACYSFTFGIPRMLTAEQGPAYLVPNLRDISAFEQSSKFQQMLDVANRAAAMIEEANKLETAFAQAIKDHKQRALIMEAGTKGNYLQEWTDIVDASKSNDFKILGEKLLRMEGAEHSRQKGYAHEPALGEDTKPKRPRREKSPLPAVTEPVDMDKRQMRRMDDDFTEEDLGRTILASMPTSKKAVGSFSAVGPGYTVSRLA